MTTVDEILSVLASLGHKPDPEARTASELAAAWGHSTKWVCSAIRVLATKGCVRVTHKVVPRIDGQTTTVPAYVVSVPGDGATSKSTSKPRVPIQSKKGSSNGTRNPRPQRRK